VGVSAVIHAGLYALVLSIPVDEAKAPPSLPEAPLQVEFRQSAVEEEVAAVIPPALAFDVVPAAVAPAPQALEFDPVFPSHAYDDEASEAMSRSRPAELDPSPTPPHVPMALVRPRSRAGHGAGSLGVGAGGPGVGSASIATQGGAWSLVGHGGRGDGEGESVVDGGGAGDLPGVGGGTRKPEPRAALAAPAYPDRARARGWEGRVVLLLEIDAQGRVVSVEVVESSGRRLLDDAARDAAPSWEFLPALQEGRPVAGSLRVPVRFALTN
jgi:protein TonB